MAILEGGHIVPTRTQATSRSPAPLGLKILEFISNQHMCVSRTCEPGVTNYKVVHVIIRYNFGFNKCLPH